MNRKTDSLLIMTAMGCALPKVHPAEKLLNLIRSQQAWTSTRALRKTLKNECNKRIPLRVVALPNCGRRSVADSGVCGLCNSFVAVVQTTEPWKCAHPTT